ncbi:ATPase inhibitor B, mitochondrial-like [Sardina pilchardus]|uniref:ATPase inhibitor B, mitochondrial-like n=1 Tax=Sardina pilchardus TaxID=27697 RepID=UPI002E15C2D2
MARFLQTHFRNVLATQLRLSSDKSGDSGKGVGKGGTGGGSSREAGAFGKMRATQEEMYFKRKEKEQLGALKEHHQEEIAHHKKEIERLQQEIRRHEGKIKELRPKD